MTTQTLKKWKEIKFKDFVKLQRGFDLPRQDRNDGEYPVIASTSVTGHHDEYKVEPPCVTTGRSGALGEVLYTKSKCWPLNTVLWVKDYKGNDPYFVYSKLKTLHLEQYNSGAGVPTLNRNHLDQIVVDVPPLEDQTQITNVLSAYDDLIENNVRRIQILEQTAQAIYRESFASMTGKDMSLSNVITIYRGKSYAGDELSDTEGLPFVNLKCIDRDGGFRKSGLKRFTGKYKDTQKVIAGDIVMAVTDMTQDRRIIARAARIPTLDGGFGIISMDLVKIEPKDGNDRDYIYSLLRWSDFSDEVKNHANGANVLHLIPDRITDFKTHIASVDQQMEFGKKVRSLLDLIDKLELQNENLRCSRDLLLPKLVTGEIRV
jgi:type I restriction enzyme S subunit